VNSAVDVGVVLFVVAVEGIEDLPRLLGCRSVIEVDERLPFTSRFKIGKSSRISSMSYTELMLPPAASPPADLYPLRVEGDVAVLHLVLSYLAGGGLFCRGYLVELMMPWHRSPAAP
jgi:hypothetical protein